MLTRQARSGRWPWRVGAVALALLACFLVGPARPARARASVYEVDSTGDAIALSPGSGTCETGAGGCTLRAAIEEANQSAATLDTIVFDLGFNGQLTDTIHLAAGLPAIAGPLTIKGDRLGRCTTQAAIPGPCVGVDGTGVGTAFQVESDGVSIEGLAMSGASTEVEVGEGATGFIARDDWVGVRLDGAEAGGELGVVLEPDADLARIGGPEAAERVVVAGSGAVGLEINGASGTVVEGDYFGVKPDGLGEYSNVTDVRIINGNGSWAENTQIGAELDPEAASSPACDGGCNVISGAGAAGVEVIDRFGSGPGSNGPATIQGNYIGLNAAGTGVTVPLSETGIFVEDAHGFTIGGAASGDANYISGGSVAVLAANAGSDFVLQGNRVGVGPTGLPVTPPGEGIGVNLASLPSGSVPEISENELHLNGGTGIGEHGVGATIAGNEIFGSTFGIRTDEFSALHPNSIRENLIEGASEDGVLVQNDLNEVAANEIVGSGVDGIRIQGPGFGIIHNLVGGDLPADENVIDGSGGDAIAIVNPENSDNEVARNRGSGNGGRFIHLIASEPATEPNGPNEGVKPPSFGAATQTGAGGSGAEPGAVIRVFRKATGALGEVQSFLGEATVNGSGTWNLAYPGSIPAGTFVAATQTNVEGGTSELSIAATSGGSSGSGGQEACPVSGGGCPPNPPRRVAPDTKILKGPPAKTSQTTAKFKFASSEPGSSFECKLDRQPFKPCRSPKTYKKLKPGKHVFKVRATDRAGDVDPTPAERKFTVLHQS